MSHTQALERRTYKMSEEKVVQQVQDSDEQFINSLLGTDGSEDEAAKAAEAQRIKNKNAEEARKRREAEAKQAEAKVEEPKAEVKEEVKVEEKKPEPVVEEVKEEPKKNNVNRLGEQLVQFKFFPDRIIFRGSGGLGNTGLGPTLGKFLNSAS